jgi:hypothetical protein
MAEVVCNVELWEATVEKQKEKVAVNWSYTWEERWINRKNMLWIGIRRG